MKRFALFIAVAITIVGCASTPRTLQEVRVDAVRSALSSEQYFMAAQELHSMVAHGENHSQFDAEFSSAKAKLKYLPQGLEYVQIGMRLSQDGFENVIATTRLLQRKNLVPDADASTLIKAVSEKVVSSAVSNFDDYKPEFLALFPGAFGDEFHIKRYKLLKAKILASQKPDEFPYRYSEDLNAMAESAYTLGRASSEYVDFEHFLSTIRLRRADLAAGKIAERFPQATRSTIIARSKSLVLTMQPDDPLLLEDLSKNLTGIEWLELNSAPYLGKGFLVSIRKLRFNEKEIPEKTITRTVGNSDLSFGALLFVPRNASMQYEVTTSGAEVDYGFEVTISVDGRILKKKIIRDHLISSSRRCSNVRYVNVFGGVGTSPFFPNDHVQSECNSGASGASLEELRQKIYIALTDQIKGELSVETGQHT